jgi:catechol 2,3-dioxygenase-like lactoylglutathione lyase family enzyme
MEDLVILETCLYVDNLEAAESFYKNVLGLRLISKVEGRHVFFRLATSVLLLFKPETSLAAGELPPHGAHGPGHCCFGVAEEEYDLWKARLRDKGVTVTAEQAWPAGGKSLYFHDPAGNVLELAPARIWGANF